MTNPKRVLLLHERGADAVAALRAHLVDEGIEVTFARTFLEAAPSLVAGRTDLFVLFLPEPEWVRNAILTETRRANPHLPIVAVTPNASHSRLQWFLARFQIANVFSDYDDWRRVADCIVKQLESAKWRASGAAARPPTTGRGR